MKPFEIDPWTEKAMMGKCAENYASVLAEVLAECGGETLASMDWTELAELFFTNGYFNGAIDAATDNDFRDDVLLMDDEIKYQKDNGF